MYSFIYINMGHFGREASPLPPPLDETLIADDEYNYTYNYGYPKEVDMHAGAISLD